MDEICEIKKVQIAFFSGTGGTKRIMEAFEKEIRQRGIAVTVTNLGEASKPKDSTDENAETEEFDLHIILFPVYALDAPRPIYDWINSADGNKIGRKAAVLSVSGGGEMWPNTGCRNGCCKALEGRGFEIIYDRMLCMPANMMAEVNDHLAMRLIQAVPQKVLHIMDDILTGKIRRTSFRKGFIRNYISKMERENSYRFGKSFIVSEECTSCGWCVKNCPVSNIKIDGTSGKPKFSDRCVACLRCVYGCPFHAIHAKNPMIFKKGFDLEAVEERMRGIEPEPIEKCCKGLAFLGVKRYLQEKD